MGKASGLMSVTGAVILLSSGIAFAQAQSKDQQGCINALNKDGAKVGATQGKANTTCIKNAGKAGGGGSQACLVSDSGGKVAKAGSKTQADFDKKCTTETPTTGVPGVFTGTAQAVNEANISGEVLFVGDVFGNPLDNAIVTDKTGAKCQSTVSKDSEKTFATYMKGFLSCKKNTLKSGGNLENCVLDDPGGKAAATLSKLNADITKACTDNIFPGLCADEPLGSLANCIGDRVACRVCETQNSMDGLHADCDALDDGLANGSCSAGRPVACELAAGSGFSLATELGPIPLVATGSIDVAIGGSEGANPASCALRELDPVSVPGVGFVCVSPSPGCDPGKVDCTGGVGTGTSLVLNASRTIGACTDNDDCDSQCAASCGATPDSDVVQAGCEGFCSGDNPSNQSCTLDSDCVGNGACNGQDGAPAGNICECQCLIGFAAPGSAGTLDCGLGVSLVVESAAPCDRTDVIITVGTTCFGLTTSTAYGVISEANAVPGAGLGPFQEMGSAVSCFGQDANDVSGMKLVGSVAFFGSTIGDILTGAELSCQ